MIEKTLNRIQNRIQSASQLSGGERAELLKLVDELGQEIEGEHPPDYLAHIENAIPRAAETGSDDTSREEDPAPHANTMDSLRDSVYEMEASHPQLAGIVNRMLEVLARIGI